MKSNTKIEKQLQKKRNPITVETILVAKKNKKWNEIASILSGPRRKRANLNLEEIDKEIKDGEKIILPGKVLSSGKITKKVKISALNFSEKAIQKLKDSKIEFNFILNEIKSNPDAKGVRILK